MLAHGGGTRALGLAGGWRLGMIGWRLGMIDGLEEHGRILGQNRTAQQVGRSERAHEFAEHAAIVRVLRPPQIATDAQRHERVAARPER